MTGRGDGVEHVAMITTTTHSSTTTPADASTSLAGNVSPGRAIYTIGEYVSCEDGPCGELSGIVIDPVSRTVTDLIAEPHGHHDLARLVPIALADAWPDSIRCSCTLTRWRELPHVQESEIVPAGASFAPTPAYGWPSYAPATLVLRHERVPDGEVELRDGQHIHAADGQTGRVYGLVVDAADQRVTHVLLRVGHLWSRKDVVVALDERDRIDAEGVHVTLTKHALAGLSPLGDRPLANVAQPGQLRPRRPS